MPSKIRKSRAGRGYAKDKTYKDGNKPAWLKDCPTLPDWVIEQVTDKHPLHKGSKRRKYERIKVEIEKVCRVIREKRPMPNPAMEAA